MTTDKKPRIAVIGSNMVDLITYVDRMPIKGETVEAPSFEMGHGGKGANQAVAAAKLGAFVVMVTKVGDDMFADNTIRNLKSFGIDTAHVERVKGRSSGVAPIMVEPSGENSILIVKGANADLSPGRHRARGRRPQGLRSHPAATRNPARNRLCGDRLRQAPRGEDRAEPGAGDARARPR